MSTEPVDMLKACPFCGCDIEIIPDIGDYPERIMVTDMHHNSCIFSGEDSLSYIAQYEGVAAFATKWNMRAA